MGIRHELVKEGRRIRGIKDELVLCVWESKGKLNVVE
jgi:hypothetical protein